MVRRFCIHPLLVLTLALLAGLGTGACVNRTAKTDASSPNPLPGDPIAPSFDPIVFPHGRGGEPGASVRDDHPLEGDDAGWAEKLKLATGYAAGGFDEEAVVVIRAALDQTPPGPWNEKFRALRTHLRLGRVESDWLRVDARGVRDYVSFDADVDWVVRVRNVSDQTLVFAAPAGGDGGASPSALSLSITRRDVDIYGAELERSWNQTVFLQRIGGCDIQVAPGGIHEATVRVPAADVGAAISGLRILDLSGTLRASVSHPSEDEPRSISLRVRGGRIVVLPTGYEPLAPHPLRSMTTAIETTAPVHLLVASEFVGRASSIQAVELLAQALGRGEPGLRTASVGALGLLRERTVGAPMAPLALPLVNGLESWPQRAAATMEGLTRLSGQALASDPRLWKDWWRRTNRQGTLVPPRERTSTPGAAQEGR